MANKNSSDLRKELISNRISVGEGGMVFVSYLGSSIMVTTSIPFQLRGKEFSLTAQYRKDEKGEFKRYTETSFYNHGTASLPVSAFAHASADSDIFAEAFAALDEAVGRWAIEHRAQLDQVDLLTQKETLAELEDTRELSQAREPNLEDVSKIKSGHSLDDSEPIISVNLN